MACKNNDKNNDVRQNLIHRIFSDSIDIEVANDEGKKNI